MNAITIDPERLAKITALERGSHAKNEAAMCAMEAVAFIAREPWSDHPKCACPVIGAFMRVWNDGLPDADRNCLLLPLIPRLVGTRGSAALETRRANMAADWFIRVQTPAWLRLAGLTKHADLLASFPEITDFSKCPPLMPALDAAGAAARAAAWDAARAAAGDAAWAAARAAARDAARDAAGDAARAAAWDAARAAAGAAAGDAAGDAAGAAARDALKSTTAELQTSALALVERMIAEPDPAVKQ
jgi:hypothetical protein